MQENFELSGWHPDSASPRSPGERDEVRLAESLRAVARANRVDLWKVTLGGSINRETEIALQRHLQPAELARGERLVVEAKSSQFLQTRLALRRILGEAVGCAPAELAIRSGENGKPFLEHGPAFTVTHSGRLAIIAVAVGEGSRVLTEAGEDLPSMALGVDAERLRSGRPLARMAQRFFAPSEAKAYLGLDASRHFEDFYRRWALKEAYVKALGTGLTYSSRAFVLRDDEPTWRLRSLLESCERGAGLTDSWLFGNGWTAIGEERFAVALCVNRKAELRFLDYRW